jgi:hypothetical protein
MTNTTDTPATPEQIAAVLRAATERADYLRWLARKIEVSGDLGLRRSVADQLRQLAEGR